MTNKFIGCGTALITPFDGTGNVDEGVLRQLIRRQIESGINFLVPCGTTGESPTLTRVEHLRVCQITLEEAKPNGIPVLAGCGGYSTAEVIEMAKELENLGVDGLLSVTPYYNKPTQEGLFQHYSAIASAVSLPIVVYSVQGRTGINVEPATLKRLSKLPTIIGVKEASGNVSQMARILHDLPPTFLVLSGDDALALPLIALGGKGLISVASNQIPREMTSLVDAALKGEFTNARKFQQTWLPLMEVNFIESNPIPVKAAMALMGFCEANWRLPLVAPSESSMEKIAQVLKSVDLC